MTTITQDIKELERLYIDGRHTDELNELAIEIYDRFRKELRHWGQMDDAQQKKLDDTSAEFKEVLRRIAGRHANALAAYHRHTKKHPSSWSA